MINLLSETTKFLEENGKSLDDVLWIGNRDGKEIIPVSDFLMGANRMYDDGYGSNEVSLDLVIVGNDWWLERSDYDGCEWWEYKTIPTLSADSHTAKSAQALIWGGEE